MQNKANFGKPEMTVMSAPQKSYEREARAMPLRKQSQFLRVRRTPSSWQGPAGAVAAERSWLQPAAVFYRPEECGRMGRKQVLECC